MINRANEVWRVYTQADALPVPDVCFSMKVVSQFAVNIKHSAKEAFILEYNCSDMAQYIQVSFFDCFVQSFKCTYISNLVGDYPFIPGKWVYIVENSEYLKSIQQEYLFPDDEKKTNWQHYVFCTDEEVIDVIAADGPSISIKPIN